MASNAASAKLATKTKSGGKGLAGKRVGRYTLVEALASGGMADIFLARHEGDKGFVKEVALKLLQSRFIDNPTVLGMFEAEARLGAKLSHPSVVDVYDWGEGGQESDDRFIAMEYIRGKTLTEVMLRSIEVSRPLPLPFAAYIALQVAEGLAYLQQGIDLMGEPLEVIHRDLSPMNLVVGVSGQTKIIDFGIARQGRRVEEESGGRPGKVSYMSPEQVQARPLDGRTDIFSLGTILYEITVGRRLWRGPTEVVMDRIVEEAPPPPTYLVRDYPPALELVVLKALEKRPEDRYQTAEDMVADLEAYLLETGERVGNRQIARYLHELFAPDNRVSERGARRAQAFLDDEGPGEEEELDFDRSPEDRPGAALARALRAAAPAAVAAAAAGPRPGAAQAAAPGPAAVVSAAPAAGAESPLASTLRADTQPLVAVTGPPPSTAMVDAAPAAGGLASLAGASVASGPPLSPAAPVAPIPVALSGQTSVSSASRRALSKPALVTLVALAAAALGLLWAVLGT
jgi:tRNA A-37 threonylcarbamoyl transferase component Bud32